MQLLSGSRVALLTAHLIAYLSKLHFFQLWISPFIDTLPTYSTCVAQTARRRTRISKRR
jgi:hypothetical protein